MPKFALALAVAVVVIGVVGIITCILGFCSPPQLIPTLTPTLATPTIRAPTATPYFTSTRVPWTPTPSPSHTPTATVPPSATVTPAPADSPTLPATDTPTPSPTPSPTATPPFTLEGICGQTRYQNWTTIVKIRDAQYNVVIISLTGAAGGTAGQSHSYQVAYRVHGSGSNWTLTQDWTPNAAGFTVNWNVQGLPWTVYEVQLVVRTPDGHALHSDGCRLIISLP